MMWKPASAKHERLVHARSPNDTFRDQSRTWLLADRELCGGFYVLVYRNNSDPGRTLRVIFNDQGREIASEMWNDLGSVGLLESEGFFEWLTDKYRSCVKRFATFAEKRGSGTTST